MQTLSLTSPAMAFAQSRAQATMFGRIATAQFTTITIVLVLVVTVTVARNYAANHATLIEDGTGMPLPFSTALCDIRVYVPQNGMT